MHTLKGNLLPDPFDAIVSYGHANIIRKHIAGTCKALIDNEERLESKIDGEASEPAKTTYQEQRAKFGKAMNEFKRRVRPVELAAKPVSVGL